MVVIFFLCELLAAHHRSAGWLRLGSLESELGDGGVHVPGFPANGRIGGNRVSGREAEHANCGSEAGEWFDE